MNKRSDLIANLIVYGGIIAFVCLVVFTIHYFNKKSCENKGGTYIFELGNQGSSCHYKVNVEENK